MSDQRSAARSRALRVVLPCFLAQNLAFGLTFGSYGPLLAANEAHFGMSRATASSGVGLFNLALGLAAPLLGGLLQRVPAKAVMIAAAILSAASYVTVALASSATIALLCYGVIGACAAALGVLCTLTVISRWFSSTRARMLGIVNLPVLMLLVPFAISALLPSIGRTATMLALAACYLVPIPLFLTLAERPGGPGVLYSEEFASASPEAALPARSIIAALPFWVLSLGIGIMAGESSAFVIHIVPFGSGDGLSLEASSGLISIFAAFGLAGSLVMGWAADRIGAANALIIATLAHAVLWSGLLAVDGWSLFALSGLMGLVLVPVVTLHGAAMSEVMPLPSIARAMGLSYLIKLPFIFGFAPITGMLFDLTGNYRMPFLTLSAMALISTGLFLLLRHLQRRPNASLLSTRPAGHA